MSAFTLDTSGHVRRPGFARPLGWGGLDPIEQGYVEALFAELSNTNADARWELVGFSDLAPETLAEILRDCAELQDGEPHDIWTREDGEAFWRQRNNGEHRGFSPLAVTLGEDGKVYLRPAGAAA